MIGTSEERFQTLLNQVVQHVTQMVNNVPMGNQVINLDEEDSNMG